MPEPELEKAADQPRPTDADLDAAANLDDKVVEPEKKIEPEKEPEPVKEPDNDDPPGKEKEPEGEPEKKESEKEIEPDDDSDKEVDEPKSNVDRSRLGRRVAGMERQINDLVGAIDRLVALKEQRPKDMEPEPEPDPDEPLTLRQMERVITAREQKRVQDSRNYTASYVKTVWQLGQEEDDATLDEIAKELDDTATYHRLSNDAVVDAERNYHKAAKAIYARRLAAVSKKKESPLERNKDKMELHTKTGAETRVPAREAKLPELDDDAKDFLKYVAKGGKGFTEDDIREALNKEIHAGKKDMRNI